MAQPAIKFDDDQIRRPSSRSRERQAPVASSSSTGVDLNNGIVFSRTISTGRRSVRGRSRDRRSLSHLSEHGDDEAGITHPGDVKIKQTFKGRKLFFLAYQSIGVIYGDIGTSPLYVFSGTFTSPPPRDDVIGVLSLIVWSLLWMVTLKYVVIVLNADNEGEGGTFSCYSLLSRFANITNRDPREEPLVRMQRYKSNDLPSANQKLRKAVEHSKFFKAILKVMGVLAVSMVISDGVLTPAQSVLGAVQGLDVIVPNISHGIVVGTTCGILVLLFVIQPFGTTKIGITFAPIVIIWLGFLAGFGIYNLVYYDAGVFKCFNPAEGFDYLIRHGTDGWRSLGGILLAFTGVEALFADLGAFSMRAIQISWLGYCLPCLLLTYVGQGAYLAVHPEAYTYPVFYTAPPGMLVPSLVIAILAAVVASQAIITATFQLLAQIVKLSYFPQIQVKHTSLTFHNQLYVPLVNYLLCIGTVVITAVFGNTTSLGQAYGVCVMFVTFFDTQMVTLVSLMVWRIRPWYIILPWAAFACVDGAFLSSALTKVPNGAWFTITLASVLAAVFILWRFGKEQQWRSERLDRKPLAHYVSNDPDGELRLTSSLGRLGGEALSVTSGFGIFFDKGGDRTPIVFSQFITKLVSKPEVTVFFHLRPLESPTVPYDERYIVQRIDHLPNCYRIVARFGYMDEVVTPDLAALIYGQVRDYVADQGSRVFVGKRATERAAITETTSPDPDDEDAETRPESDFGEKHAVIQGQKDAVSAQLDLLKRAFEHRVLYIIGKEEMYVAPKTRWWRLVLLKIFLFLRENTRNKMANVKVPTDRLVEIGFVMEV